MRGGSDEYRELAGRKITSLEAKMAKTSLISRMDKAGAPKTWIQEVQTLNRRLETLTQLKDEYGVIIDSLARQLEREEEEFAEFERDR